MVTGGKASSGSIPKMVGCLLLLLANEKSERQTVVAGGVVCPLAVEASGNILPKMAGCAASLGWQGKRRTVVTGGKASSGSIPQMVGCLLFLLAHEASVWRTVVAGGVVRPLAVEASGGSIPEMVGGACYFFRLARRAASCGDWRQGKQR